MIRQFVRLLYILGIAQCMEDTLPWKPGDTRSSGTLWCIITDKVNGTMVFNSGEFSIHPGSGERLALKVVANWKDLRESAIRCGFGEQYNKVISKLVVDRNNVSCTSLELMFNKTAATIQHRFGTRLWSALILQPNKYGEYFELSTTNLSHFVSSDSSMATFRCENYLYNEADLQFGYYCVVVIVELSVFLLVLLVVSCCLIDK